jgi:dTDP-4-amino-4,6-dideoxygalactose transaminase
MAGIQGAVLNVKLKYLQSWHDARRKNAAIYDKLLAGSKVQTPRIDEGAESIYNQYVVRVKNRDAVKQKLADAGVATAVYYPLPLHLQPCFAYLGHKEGAFPESERACREVLALPIYPELSEEEVRYVAQQLRDIAG